MNEQLLQAWTELNSAIKNTQHVGVMKIAERITIMEEKRAIFDDLMMQAARDAYKPS